MERALQHKIAEQREEFRKLADTRMETIERTIDAYIPPEITVQEREAIKEETKMQYEGAKNFMSSDLDVDYFV